MRWRIDGMTGSENWGLERGVLGFCNLRYLWEVKKMMRDAVTEIVTVVLHLRPFSWRKSFGNGFSLSVSVCLNILWSLTVEKERFLWRSFLSFEFEMWVTCAGVVKLRKQPFVIMRLSFFFFFIFYGLFGLNWLRARGVGQFLKVTIWYDAVCTTKNHISHKFII